ncbi:hypothetical protein BJ170DRAFT_710291 [Xylariales sp. AK1849]|nr:hypothetical protein BJ170DRAFT_710291 [Xylariales sp. AK1849]
MGPLNQNGSLDIIIAGAGIAGVTAAVALRQAGHTVHLLEKSNLKKLKIVLDVPKIEPGTWAVLRADSHAELMRLAREVHYGTESGGFGPPLDLRLGARVQSVVSRDDGAEVVLEGGETVCAHIVVGADGGNSVVRSYVLGVSADEARPVHSGMAAFRFLLETNKLKAEKELAAWLEKTVGRVTLLADMTETTKVRHIIWYGCHGSELQNFVGIHPSETQIVEESNELKGAMTQE